MQKLKSTTSQFLYNSEFLRSMSLQELIDLMADRTAKYIAAYAPAMNGQDAFQEFLDRFMGGPRFEDLQRLKPQLKEFIRLKIAENKEKSLDEILELTKKELGFNIPPASNEELRVTIARLAFNRMFKRIVGDL